MDEWQPIDTAPHEKEVWTKIDDQHGERNLAKLTKFGTLWYTSPDPEKGMYVYYMPTHWKTVQPSDHQ